MPFASPERELLSSSTLDSYTSVELLPPPSQVLRVPFFTQVDDLASIHLANHPTSIRGGVRRSIHRHQFLQAELSDSRRHTFVEAISECICTRLYDELRSYGCISTRLYVISTYFIGCTCVSITQLHANAAFPAYLRITQYRTHNLY